MRRFTFSIDDTRGAEIEAYARGHGYSSGGDFARVATLRVMSMYPLKRASSSNQAAEGGIVAPEVPQTRQDGSSKETET